MELNKDISLFYGIMLGDGCLSKFGRHKIIAITLNLKDDTKFLNKIVHPLLTKFTGRKISTRVRKYKNCTGVNFQSNSLFDKLASIGYPIGKKLEIFIPKLFYNKNLIKYVCQGLFSTDGSLVLTNNNGTLYPRVEICSISKTLMLQVNNYLNKKQVKCNFYVAKRKKSRGIFGDGKQQYRLQINGRINLIKFNKIIGFINPKQIDRFNYYFNVSGRI